MSSGFGRSIFPDLRVLGCEREDRVERYLLRLLRTYTPLAETSLVAPDEEIRNLRHYADSKMNRGVLISVDLENEKTQPRKGR